MSENPPKAIAEATKRNESHRGGSTAFMSTTYIQNKILISLAHNHVMGVEVLEAALGLPGDNNQAIDIEIEDKHIETLEKLGDGDIATGAQKLIEMHSDRNTVLTQEQMQLLFDIGAKADKYGVVYDSDKQTPVVFRDHNGIVINNPVNETVQSPGPLSNLTDPLKIHQWQRTQSFAAFGGHDLKHNGPLGSLVRVGEEKLSLSASVYSIATQADSTTVEENKPQEQSHGVSEKNALTINRDFDIA